MKARKTLKDIHIPNSLILIAYLGFLFWRMFVYAYGSHHRVPMDKAGYNLIPFKTITDFIEYSEHISLQVLFYNLIGNIAVFVPLGFLVPLCKKKGMRFVRVVFIAFVLIFAAEAMQYILKVGVFDVDDIILNILGVMIGYAAFIPKKRNKHG